MKRWMLCLFVGCFVAFLGGNCWGATYNGIVLSDGSPVLIVDGTGGSNSVTFNWNNSTGFGSSFVFGQSPEPGVFNSDGFTTYYNGGFVTGGTATKNGQDVINFAIKDNSNEMVYSLRDYNGTVTLYDHTSDLNSWYTYMDISWDIDGTVFGVTFASITTTGGFAAPVPIPTTAFLLGTGVLGLVGVRRKFMK